MDQFVTTQRKDYLWPYVRTFGKKLIEPALRDSGFDKKCMCRCYPPLAVPQGHQYKYLDQSANLSEQDWSRLGPMGPLLDAKLYPVQAGKPPETDTMRADQPNMFLKLHEKYPFLYEILQTAPAADLNSKVDKDRLKSTYQVDYCQMDEYSPDDMLRAQGVEGLGPNSDPTREPGLPYRQRKKEAASFSAMAGKGFGFVGAAANKAKELRGGGGGSGGGGGGGGESGGISIWVPVKTEYQDAICKVADVIMREKLHYHNKKRP